MKGFMYHNFVLAKICIREVCGLQALLVFLWAVLAILSKGETLNQETLVGYVIVGVAMLLCSFLFTEFISGEIFKQSEGASWCSFALTTPGSVIDYMSAKYEFVFMTDLLTLFLWVMTDVVLLAINPNFISIQSIAFILWAFQLLLHALELVSSTGFGATMGGYVKYGFIGVLIFAVIIYALYGDLSFFKQDKPLEALMKIIEESKALYWFINLLPGIAVAVYLASYKLAVKIYRKGAANYEQ